MLFIEIVAGIPAWTSSKILALRNGTSTARTPRHEPIDWSAMAPFFVSDPNETAR